MTEGTRLDIRTDRLSRELVRGAPDIGFRRVQRIASAAGCLPLARLGTRGKWFANVERDFQRLLALSQSGILQLKPTLIPVPVRQPRGHGVTTVMWPVFAPHQTFAALFDQKCEHFLLGKRPDQTLVEFWKGAAGDPVFADHPSRAQPELLSKTIPIRCHGDEGQGQKKSPLMILSWGSAVVHGDPLATRVLITVIPSKVYAKNQTLDAIYRYLAYSFHALHLGRWPAEPFIPGDAVPNGGLQLAHGFRCGFVGFKGDTKFLKAAFAHRRNWQKALICPECYASRSDPLLNYLDMSPSAPWRCTVEAHPHFVSNTRPEDLPPLFRIPGLRKELVHWDLLHVLFLGTGQDFCGSALLELVRLGRFRAPVVSDRSPLDRHLHQAFLQFRTWAVAHGLPCSLDDLTERSLGGSADTYPSLPGKASDCKSMLSFLATITAPLAFSDDFYEQVLACSAWAIAEFLWLLDSAGMFLDASQASRAKQAGELFLSTYVWLASHAVSKGWLQWKVRPKMHSLHHICLRLAAGTVSLNPRFTSCWGDEGFVGQVAKVARRCHPRTLALRTMQRWLLVAPF